MALPLQNKVALVTGASRGIGAAIAKRLAADGAEIIVHYGNSQAQAQAVVASIVGAGGKAIAVQADLSKADGPRALAAAIKHGRIDILVNNAGVAPFADLASMTEESFDMLSNVNMRSVFFVTQQMLPKLVDGGRVINLSSAVARVAFPGIPAYSATKGFVDVLTLQLAAALGPRNITVNAVAPGAIDTEMSAWIHQPGGTDTLKAIQALPGVGKPEHIAGMVAFLAGPDGAWTTGRTLDVSGGTKL
jgi:3-oxoacyl-[acyl-carrier protein] reductase